MNIKALSVERRDQTWTFFHLGAVLLILALYLFFLFSPIHDYKIGFVLINPLTIALTSVFLFRSQGKFTWDTVILCAFCLWYGCTCVLNGNYYLLDNNGATLCLGLVLASVVFYQTPAMLSQDKRKRFLSLFLHIFAITLGALAWIGVIATYTGQAFVSPFTGLTLGGNSASRLTLFHIHPNMAATFFLIGLCMLFYLAMQTKKKSLWIPYLLGLLGFYLAIALTGSRTIYILTSLCAGAFAFLLLHKRLSRSSKWIGWLSSIGIWLTVAALLFGGFSLITQLMNAHIAARKAAVISQISEELPEKKAKKEIKAQTRSIKPLSERPIMADIATLTGRTAIYQTVIPVLEARPQTLWIGTAREDFMKLPNEILLAQSGKDKIAQANHMHNLFLQVLLITGLPGLLLVIVFVVILAVQSFRLFFLGKEEAPLPMKALVVLPCVLLLNCMLEPYVFVENNLVNLIFFFSSGAVMIYAKELLPPFFKSKRAAA